MLNSEYVYTMNSGIFLLLGSNEGDPVRNLDVAREQIVAQVGVITKQSSLYRTAAWGIEEQPDFLNQVLEIATALTPEVLLEKILAIELAMGRVRTKKWGPRLIDIDLLFYGGEVRDTKSLILPHPGIPERRFTLLPLSEIAPEFIHPMLKKTVVDLLRECSDPLEVLKFKI